MSSAKNTIESFEDRLESLDDVIGDFAGADLYGTVSRMSVEVGKMFHQGQEYSEQMMGLLDEFNRNEIVDECQMKSRIIMSCYEKMMESLRRLDHLESIMSELRNKMEMRTDVPVKLDAVVELPLLMNRCHSLLVRSILVAKRFMEMNLRFNEFWIKTEEKLDDLS